MRYLILYLKGMLMGAADLVPGVSGGTIALITGIYKELLESINSISLSNLKLVETTRTKISLGKNKWTLFNRSFWRNTLKYFTLVKITGMVD
jgi:uncharacterized membrane protein